MSPRPSLLALAFAACLPAALCISAAAFIVGASERPQMAPQPPPAKVAVAVTVAVEFPRELPLHVEPAPKHLPLGAVAVPEDPLARAIRTVPSTGWAEVDAGGVAELLREVAAPCPDGDTYCPPTAWEFAAVVWKESGFRAWAVEGDRGVRGAGTGPGLGLFGLHRAFLPPGVDAHEPRAAALEASAKAGRLLRHHARACKRAKPHHWLAHWAAGYSVEGNEYAVLYAVDALSRVRRLRAAGGAGPGD